MSSTLEINGKELHSIRALTERTSYSRDYITRLAREGKIVASLVNRQWFVDPASLEHYEAHTDRERQERQERLRDERRRERRERELALHSARLQTNVLQTREKIKTPTRRVPVTALGVLLIGLGVGFAVNELSRSSMGAGVQSAGTALITPHTVPPVGTVVTTTEVGSEVNFSHESVGLSTLEGADMGVLLLPNNELGVSDPAKLFSDEVRVLLDAEGNRIVARVDDQGRVVEQIPFVIVPVTHEATP